MEIKRCTLDCAAHGILPGTDITEALHALLCAHSENTEFVFAPGEYYFSPKFTYDYRLSNTDVLPTRKLGIWMRGMKHITLDFGGSRLYFVGQMQPFTLDGCEDITVRNAVVDWKKPLVAEGIVRDVHMGDTQWVDMYVDPQAFPHEVRDAWLWFDTGNGEWYPLQRGSAIQYDVQTRTVRRDSGDRFNPVSVEDLGNCVYRFHTEDASNVAPGNIFVLRHNDRMHAGAFCEMCRDITFEDITFHSCGGLGCLAQFSENLTYRRVHFLPNVAAGRLISGGRDDGMHITCNRGTVTIEECSFVGLMDDPINVHGCCVTVTRIENARTLVCKYEHPQACGFHYWAQPGDTIGFIERKHMSAVGRAVVAQYTLGETLDSFTVVFEEDLPEDILVAAGQPAALSLDNLTNTVSFICRRNRFGSCRARGVLLSTPKPVRITDNVFASSGAAILVAGDSNFWFESGECHDVEISNNVFTDACLTSVYQFGEGIISICPIVPEPDIRLPFHKNIRIHDNVFDTADTPVVYAYSTAHLTFENNTVFRSPAAEKWTDARGLIRFDHCVNVTARNNRFIGPFSIDRYECTSCEELHLER
ncbi:MAG: right-handed parallel beta-helix repeat-containing protein [Clostridia bacterium]|nr:right-handed parallel beta-helix repeat-containing protein [Clostridia bacterium]